MNFHGQAVLNEQLLGFYFCILSGVGLGEVRLFARIIQRSAGHDLAGK